VHNLYTITLYDSKAKVMVQGNCREEWVLQEFPKFKSIINDIWDDGISLREAYLHRHMGKTIDFQEQELLFSDCEDEKPDSTIVLSESEVAPATVTSDTKKRKLVSPKKSAKSGHRKSPGKCDKSKPDAKLIAVGNLQNLEERMENVDSSISNHDLPTLAVDLTALNFEEKLCHISNDFDAKMSAISSEVKHDLQPF